MSVLERQLKDCTAVWKFKYQMMQLLLYVRLQEVVVEDSFYPHLNGLKNIILKNGCDNKAKYTQKTDGIFWDETQNCVKEHNDMNLEEIYIDNMAQQLVVNPEQFNNSVILSTNLFMDIISELASGIVGSIGLIYSANMGDSYAMFEAAHGSAPSFKGQNKVNPTATILAGAWMAEYLGESHIREAIFSATEHVINEGKTITFDIGGNASTSQMVDAITILAKEKLRK
uniref:Isocitrate dehydrogenase (IDH1, IDH2, icd) n=1 Tax=uncultured marine thaumarchaeote SAT1000_10_H08 TaxID=1456376 RepID=A0A075I9V2_9ARCH|nr:isocitrate dehydrogenase (IDH1, IDH2, icd) [uncultured marine thaumarchaeote SAT1000_10_H08]